MARRALPIQVWLKPPAVWEKLARRNLSQNDLARQLGITSGYLSQLINRQRSPSPVLRERLLHVLGDAEFDDLFTIEHRNVPGDDADGYA